MAEKRNYPAVRDPAGSGKGSSLPTSEPGFPNLEARHQFDFEMHVKKAMEQGMSREEAEEHAREDMNGEHEGRIDPHVKFSKEGNKDASSG